MNGYEVRKVTFAPGWKWSNDFKPAQKTEWCEQMHIMYHLSGRMHIKSSDGTEMDVGPGDLMVIPPKHDGWVVGKEPAVVLDFAGVASKK
jgi:mannose-6-phosphate isomerase-like protein (cupin superfamily)